MVVSWTEGPDHGLVWEHGLALVDASVPTDVVSRLWADLRGGGDLAGFLKRLGAGVGADLLSLPSFAIALRAPSGGWQLAARGALEVRADGVIVRGADISTWAERFLPEGRTIVLGVVDAAAPARPIVAGLVPAAGLSRDDAPEPRISVPAAVVMPTEDARSSLPLPDEASGRVALQKPEPEAEPEPESGSQPESAPEPQPDSAPEPQPESAPEPEQESGEEPEPADAPDGGVPVPRRVEASGEATLVGDEAEPAEVVPIEPPIEPPPPGRFARQYGETQMLSVQDAAVREREEPQFISGVPGSDASDPPASAPSPGSDAFGDDGDHDGYTIMSGVEPVKVTAAGPEDVVVPGGPTVLGVLCVQGHANPPHRAECGLCGGHLVGEPRRVERPSLGTVVAPNGERIELTAPLIVGRTPRADRVQGPVMPRLVPLSQGHVSGNHLELRLEEWSVLAVDLHSTNGTFLRRHGEAPVRLGERPELLIQGDVLDLGHGVQFILERLR